MPARFAAVALALLIAVFSGSLAGNAAVAGMNGFGDGATPPMIGDERATLAGLPDDPTGWTPPETRSPGVALAAVEPRADCLDCSDYEAGYRWAAAHDVDDADRCAGDSAAFEDGCAAWIGDGEASRRS